MTAPRIVSTPGTCGGRPRIDGTRITTALVWSAEQQHARDQYPHVPDDAWSVALDFERAMRDAPLPDDDVEYLATLATLVERTASRTRDPYDAHPEHGPLREALDLACERARIDNVAGLRGLAAAGVMPTREQIQALRYPLAETKRKRGRR